MFKMLLLPSPGWVKDVEKHGKLATAVVRSDPKEILKGVAGYQGRDGWVDVLVLVQPGEDPPYEAKMKCRLSHAIGGMLEPPMKDNVRYDPKDKQRVLLVDDINTLLSCRLKS